MKKIFFFSLLFNLIALYNYAQSSINSSYFQVMSARALGPSTMSGRITAIDGIVSEKQVNLYVGTAGGGIWKSQNGGQSFSPIFDKYCQSIGALAIEPGNAKIVYAGTGESNMRNSVSIGVGLYKTTDGGSNWQKLGLDSTEHISKILIDPTEKKTIYVAAPGPLWHDSPHRGLYKSTDAGKSWQKILFVDNQTGCADIAIHPQQSNILLASCWQFRRKAYAFNSGGPGSGLFKSEDGGKTWKKLTKGLPEGLIGRIVIAMNPSQPSQVLAIVEAKDPGLFISNDLGETWKKLSVTENITARPFYFSTLVHDPKDPKRVYRPSFAFEYSDDGGYSWSGNISGGVVPHSDHHALWVNPQQTDQLFLGTDGGVYVSYNRGSSWQFLNNLPVGQFYHVSVDQKKDYRVYGGLQDNNSWVAPASQPGGVAASDWKVIGGGDGFWVQSSPLNPNIMFSESQGGEMNRIDLSTGLTTGIRPKKQAGEAEHRWNWNTPIVVAPSNSVNAQGKKVYNLYTGSQYLFRSRDEGRSWDRISPDLTTNDSLKRQQTENSGGITGDNTSAENHCTIFTVAQRPENEQIIWVGTDDGHLQVTTNGGKTWSQKEEGIYATGVPKRAWISSITLSEHQKQRVFVTLDHHMYGDHATYAVVSEDGGNTWKRFVSDEFTGFAHIILEDPLNPNLVFLGTEMGFFISLDAGKSWMRSKYQNLPWYLPVRDLKINTVTNDLILATHGRGIYIIDNLQPLRDIAKADVNKDFYFISPEPFEYNLPGQFPQAPSNISGWVAESKVVFPAMYYYMKDRSTDAVKIAIYDAGGKKIKDLNGTGVKGLNKVYWNLSINPPKVAKGGFIAQSSVLFASVFSPNVPIGKYKIIITHNKIDYEQWLTIKPNNNAGFTNEKQQKLFEQAMRLYKMEEDLYKWVDTLDKKIAMVEKTDTSNSAVSQKLKALQDLRKEIIETNRKTIFFDEFKFRRRLSDLYISVCSQTEPLSASQEKGINVMQQELDEFIRRIQTLL
ncbi:MAG: glycosyl hydrolase [Chitinophagia bacterium]|nr:glycosyl hydrolase [Chitinophagia bacterium]